MESTRIWLADTLEREFGACVRGLGAWLDASADLGPKRAARVARLVCRALLSWLRHGRPGAPARARRFLPDERAAGLARTSLLETLKEGGHLGRAVGNEVAVLLDRFFHPGAPIGPVFAN